MATQTVRSAHVQKQAQTLLFVVAQDLTPAVGHLRATLMKLSA
jgi:hypothetical protein